MSAQASRRSMGIALALVLTSAFIVANAFNAVRKGGDADVLFEGGRRLVHGLPLYEGSSPASGFIGPPFQALALVPLAIVRSASRTAAKLTWYVFNVFALGVGLVCWLRACEGLRPLSAGSAWASWRDPGLAFLAVLLPLQTNFEHQNMNALLLGLLGGAAWCLVSGRAGGAGALLGVATALKVFPALLLVYLVGARAWRSLVVAVTTAIALTVLPLVAYAPSDAVGQVVTWLRISSGGWPRRGNNQSLLAAVDRVTTTSAAVGVTNAAESRLAFGVFVFLAVVAVGAALFVFFRRPRAKLLAAEVSAVVALAVLLSPIAWDHYWTLLFPAFLLVRYGSHPTLLGRWGTWTFWTAAALTTGISRMTVGRSGWATARDWSVNTIAAVLLYVALLLLCRTVSRSERSAGE